jgi:hypothetical protein
MNLQNSILTDMMAGISHSPTRDTCKDQLPVAPTVKAQWLRCLGSGEQVEDEAAKG